MIDDGSTDSSGAICDKYREKDSRVVVVHQENKGRSAARNAGLDVLTGDYVGFVDADDYIKWEMYEQLLNGLKKKDADICGCNFIHYYQITGRSMNSVQFKEQFIDNRELIVKRILKTSASLCNKLFKNKIFKKLRFPVNREGEDAFVIPYIYGQIDKIQFLSECLYYYRKHDGSSITMRKYQKGDIGILEANLHVYCSIKKHFPSAENECVFRVLVAFKRIIQKMEKCSSDEKKKYKKDINKCRRTAIALYRKLVASKEFEEADQYLCLIFALNPYLCFYLVKTGFFHVYMG